MYHEVADSPLSAIDYIMAGGGAMTDRDMMINDAKIKAVDNFKQQWAITKSAEMIHDLEVKKSLRNIEAEKVDWTTQGLGLLAVVGLGVLAKKYL